MLRDFLPLLIPALVGFLISTVRLYCDLKHPESPLKIRRVFLWVLVFSQIFLLLSFKYIHPLALLIFTALLFGIGFSANLFLKGNINKIYFLKILFTLFAIWWILQKYILTSQVLDYLQSIWPKIHNINPEIVIFTIVGISYIGFKLITFMSDFQAGVIKECHPFEFVGWLIFFPSILAGPMMRFEEWQQQLRNPEFSLNSVFYGLHRIILGLFMKLVIADTIHAGAIDRMNANTISQSSFEELLIASFLYSIYLFFDFAGYSHIAIGVSRFWGIVLPENFNKPYLARNLADFWNRWHMTLSSILRDYLFYPISLATKRSRILKDHKIISTAIPPLLTFLAAGLWHGASLHFIIYGGLMGLGLAVVALLKQMRKGLFGIWWERSKLGYISGVVMTLSFVNFTFIFFCLDSIRLEALMNRIMEILSNT